MVCSKVRRTFYRKFGIAEQMTMSRTDDTDLRTLWRSKFTPYFRTCCAFCDRHPSGCQGMTCTPDALELASIAALTALALPPLAWAVIGRRVAARR